MDTLSIDILIDSEPFSVPKVIPSVVLVSSLFNVLLLKLHLLPLRLNGLLLTDVLSFYHLEFLIFKIVEKLLLI